LDTHGVRKWTLAYDFSIIRGVWARQRGSDRRWYEEKSLRAWLVQEIV